MRVNATQDLNVSLGEREVKRIVLQKLSEYISDLKIFPRQNADGDHWGWHDIYLDEQGGQIKTCIEYATSHRFDVTSVLVENPTQKQLFFLELYKGLAAGK
jgi:hypothetical protein